MLRKLKASGARLTIFTGRLDPEAWGREASRQPQIVAKWLRFHDIPFDRVTATKPGRAFVILDDRAIQFKDDWLRTYTQIEERRKEFDELVAMALRVRR